MDPVSLILAALVAGASAGVGEAASSAVRDAYAGLKRLVGDRFADKPVAVTALVEYESDPDTWQAPLTKSLAEIDIAEDSELLAAAGRVLRLTDPSGTADGKYNVDLRGARQVQVGDGNQQANY